MIERVEFYTSAGPLSNFPDGTPPATGYSSTPSPSGGQITVDTITDFVIEYYGYPTAGQLVATGEGGAKVRLTAQADGVNVFLEYDLDGDGIYESNNTVTWDSL